MADLTITPGNIALVDGRGLVARGTSGYSGTVGDVIYRSAATDPGKWLELDVDDAAVTADISTLQNSIGILLTGGAADDDPLIVFYYGLLAFGAILTQKVAYYGSDTLGGIKPAADLDAGDVPIFLGTGMSTSQMFINPVNHLDALV